MIVARVGEEEREGEELARLIHQAGAGDPEALGALADRFRGQVTGWAEGVVRDRDEAEDVAQGVLGGLARRLAKFRGEGRFTTWLYRVTRNAAIDRVRTETRQAALRMAAATELNEQTFSPHEAPPPVDLGALIRSFDSELTPREREVFRMIDLEGIDTARVGKRLGIAPSTVRVLLARARRTVRARMVAQHGDLIREAGYDV